MIDLSNAGISAIERDGQTLRIGGAATLTAIRAACAEIDDNHLLARALRETATGALRNRITIGGSIAMFPPWSGLIGPLVALDARVTIVAAGDHPEAKTVPVGEYLTYAELRRDAIITAVEIPISAHARYGWFRFVRVHFDYASFSLAVALEYDDGAVHEARIVVVGTKNRFDRLSEVEERVRGGAPAAVSIADFPSTIQPRNGFSGEYLTEVAIVHLRRMLDEIVEGT
jgi:carbon-monoxide dehydrogenase medium subunit